ncbi:MAG TPA: SDR family NAD(P)-dependent oxidoreductase [Pirellulales bacterium]|jgi:short-subunit dehydrogenase|nr:SDR family NAD(P)-dependent oxidoreductase [Pirellulales bacterium]
MAKRALSGLRGVLTGASSGIGRALAIELVGHGVRLVLVARRGEELERLARQLDSTGTHVQVVVGDVTDDAVRQAAIETALRNWWGLDLVINNAGIGARSGFAEASSERLRKIMEVNFFAPTELIRAAIPQLKQGHTPIVVNVGSILGHRGVPRHTDYCASKFALRGLSESLRAELAPLGIDLLLVSPGRTETDFLDHSLARENVAWDDERAVKPAYVARRIAQAIESGRHEIVVNYRGQLLVWLNRLAPRLLDRILARHG